MTNTNKTHIITDDYFYYYALSCNKQNIFSSMIFEPFAAEIPNHLEQIIYSHHQNVVIICFDSIGLYEKTLLQLKKISKKAKLVFVIDTPLCKRIINCKNCLIISKYSEHNIIDDVVRESNDKSLYLRPSNKTIFTHSQQSVLSLLSYDSSIRKVAKKQNLAVKTLYSHKNTAMKKMELARNNSLQLFRYAPLYFL